MICNESTKRSTSINYCFSLHIIISFFFTPSKYHFHSKIGLTVVAVVVVDVVVYLFSVQIRRTGREIEPDLNTLTLTPLCLFFLIYVIEISSLP